MAEQSKAELIAELERARVHLSHSMRGVAHSLDFHARFRESVGRNKVLWFSGAAAAGWILARLPSRRKKASIHANKHAVENIKETRNAGMMLSLLKFGITILKPAITAFAAKKITDMARGDGNDTRTSGR